MLKLPPLPDHVASQTINSMKNTVLQNKILIAVIVLFIISSTVGMGIYQINQRNISVTATEQANATATVQTQVAATVLAIASNPYPSYLTGNGMPAFADPLSQENESKWSSSTNSDGGACQFTGGAYHVSQQTNNYFYSCAANGTFSNFAFEVKMTIIQGNCGGTTFRNDNNGHFYYFDVCQDGNYRITRYFGYSGSSTTGLGSGRSLAIHTGLGQRNKIAVVADGSTMAFYVNEQQINHVQDDNYPSGIIGLIASPYYQTGSATDVAYSNAKLWTL